MVSIQLFHKSRLAQCRKTKERTCRQIPAFLTTSRSLDLLPLPSIHTAGEHLYEIQHLSLLEIWEDVRDSFDFWRFGQGSLVGLLLLDGREREWESEGGT